MPISSGLLRFIDKKQARTKYTVKQTMNVIFINKNNYLIYHKIIIILLIKELLKEMKKLEMDRKYNGV